MTERRLRIGHLYPEAMNLYGDRGNVTALARRAQWRGIIAEVAPLWLGAPLDLRDVDILFAGGDQDQQQTRVAHDLRGAKADAIRRAIDDGLPALVVCGSYQLFGHAYRPADGPELPGIGVFDLVTRHFGAATPRSVGNIIADWDGYLLVGFENHGGRTYLGAGAQPLARVVVGGGNNAEDGTEGARVRNAIGTYLHGSLLPKNPKLADWLIARALERRYGDGELAPLDDSLEEEARRVAIARARQERRDLVNTGATRGKAGRWRRSG